MIDMIDPDGFASAKTLHATNAVIETTGIGAIPRAFLTGKALKRAALDADEVSRIENETDMEKARNDIAILRMITPHINEMAKELGTTSEQAKLGLIAYCLTNNPKHLENFGNIIEKADDMLSDRDEVPQDGPSDEWWERIHQGGRVVSSDELQDFFAAMVAGEVGAPGSVSFQTIEVAKRLDPATATMFAKWVSMSIYSYPSRFLCTLGREAGQNELGEFGFTYFDLVQLADIGLIGSDYNAWIDVKHHVTRKVKSDNGRVRRAAWVFDYAGQSGAWVLAPKGPTSGNEARQVSSGADQLRLDVMFATKAGTELASLIPVQENKVYTAYLRRYLANKGYALAHTTSL